MKKEKLTPKSNEIKSGPGSNPQNKFKKSKGKLSTFNSIDSKITGAVEKTNPRTGSGLANEGTSVSYEDER